ncbi:MAG: OsmC family protein [Moraxellaceae bacterium]|nr:OsmC family protein [Moraxellaceae bacterium]
MSSTHIHSAVVLWQRGEHAFVDQRYSRAHLWRFDGGLEVAASSSPQVVPVPLSDASAVDPEEAFVASLASCHMLWFLSLAAARGFCVDRYEDNAAGVMAPDAAGNLWIAEVCLRPAVRFAGASQPTRNELDALHHAAHEACFIARSVRSALRCEPVYDGVAAA